MTTHRWGSSDRGDTLIEVLVAMAILGLAAIAIMSGLALSASISGKDRSQSTATTSVRNYAEYIETTIAAGGYSAGGTYPWTPPSGTGTVSLTAKCTTATAASTTVSVTSTTFTATPSWTACPISPASSDGGVQQLTLTATAPNGSTESLTLVVRRACDGGAVTTC